MRSISALTGALLMLAALAAPAAAAPAPSTVTPACVGGALGCSQVDFFFDAPGGATLDFFRIILTGGGWSFSAAQPGEAEDAWGVNLFSALVSPDGGSLSALFDVFQAEAAPGLRLRAQMVDNSRGDAGSLGFRYEAGQGSQVLFAGQVGTSATVTPEPASMALLGTGLSGLVGVLRRRRRERAEG